MSFRDVRDGKWCIYKCVKKKRVQELWMIHTWKLDLVTRKLLGCRHTQEQIRSELKSAVKKKKKAVRLFQKLCVDLTLWVQEAFVVNVCVCNVGDETDSCFTLDHIVLWKCVPQNTVFTQPGQLSQLSCSAFAHLSKVVWLTGGLAVSLRSTIEFSTGWVGIKQTDTPV